MDPAIPALPPSSRLTQRPTESPSPIPQGQGSKDGKGHKKAKQRQRDNSNREDPDDEGNGGGSGKSDGPRYPEVDDMPKRYDCPFHKSNPARYPNCNGLKRFCDVIQHVERRHVLGEDDYYCAKCRHVYVKGNNPKATRDNHMRAGTCSPSTIADTGMMLPEEYNNLRRGLHKMGSNTRPEEKWMYMWREIFRSNPPSPYVENIAITILSAIRRKAETSFCTTLSVNLYNRGYDFEEKHIRSSIQQSFDTMFPDPSSLSVAQLSTLINSGNPEFSNDIRVSGWQSQNDLTDLSFPGANSTMPGPAQLNYRWLPNTEDRQ